jgi:hypothetical protein
LTKLLGREDFRRAFLTANGLAALHRLLSDEGAARAAQRRALATIADLAPWQVHIHGTLLGTLGLSQQQWL